MLDIDQSSLKVDIISGQSERLANPAAQMEEDMDKQTVPQVSGLVLEAGDFCRLKVGLQYLHP